MWSTGHQGAKLKLKGSYRAIHFLQKKTYFCRLVFKSKEMQFVRIYLTS